MCCRAGSSLALGCALALALLLEVLVCPAAGSGFLSGSLPLSVVVTTPVEIANARAGDSVTLTSRQALQVVFTRPVIALGSDFGAANNFGGRAPFSLTCSVPGRFRWVTTAIARFDPSVDWPADLDCSLLWNSSLTSYDGLPLQLGSIPAQRRLTTYPLAMSVSGVSSARADNVTGGLWSATVGAPWDSLPEVPPDGQIQLSFSYPVNLTLLAASLRLQSDSAQVVGLNVSRCQSPVYPLPWARGRVAGPVTAPTLPGPPLSLDYVDSCAQVTPKTALETGARYTLLLPNGSRYNLLAGPLDHELRAEVFGLRRFRVPLKQDFQLSWDAANLIYDGSRYRRLDLWLPHGLSPDTPPSLLASQIQICRVARPRFNLGRNEDPAGDSECTPVNFSLSMARPGLARLDVPTLQPRSLYRLNISASQGVRDGFGLALEASEHRFWSVDVSAAFVPPGVNLVSLFELGADGGGPVVWPILGVGPTSLATPQFPEVSSAAAWPVRVTDEASVTQLVRLFTTTSGGLYVPELLGEPAQEVQLPRSLTAADAPVQLNLTLDPAQSRVHVVHTCCSYQSWNHPRTRNSAAISLITITHLSAAFAVGPASVTAWVTDTSEAAAGPVAGATAWVFLQRWGAGVQLLGSCITDASGACAVALQQAQNGQLVGVVVKDQDVAVISDAGYFSPPIPPPYIGTLVADRLLLRPGDLLHLTGYLQTQAPDGTLSLPGAGLNVSLQISRGWDPAHPDQAVTVPVTLDAETGSLHTNVVVPIAAVVGQFTFSLLAPLPRNGSRRLSELYAVDPEPIFGSAESFGPETVSHGFAGAATTSSSAAFSGGAGGDYVLGRKPMGGAHHTGDTRRRHTLSKPVPTESSDAYEVSEPLGATSMSISVSGGRGMLPVLTPPNTDLTTVASIQVTVADPRPPTAELLLLLPAWARPNASVPVSVLCASLIGSSVSGANVTLTWATPKASGLLSLVTDAAGAAAGAIALGALPEANATSEGETLSVTAQWVGPTRELLVKTVLVPLQQTARTVSISRHPETDIPSIPFAVTVSVSTAETATTLPGVPITVTLAPSTSGPPCGGNGTGVAPVSCTLVSGSMALDRCQLALPCVGEFNLTACTNDTAEVACSTVKVGRNASTWAAAPLVASPEVKVSVANASSTFVVGDTVALAVQVPRTNSSLLLLWGNAQGQRNQSITSLPAGPATVTLPLGAECRGGCGVLALLSAPRAGPAPPVPTSALFDPARPISGSSYVSLTVREARRLNVSLSLSGPAVGPATAAPSPSMLTVMPGDNTSVSVSVLEPGGAPVSGAEVTFIAVDKSILSLLPYELQDVSSAMQQALAASLSAVDSGTTRVGAAAVQAAAAAALRRTAADPWISLDFQCLPQPWRVAPVDIPDADFYAGLTSALTYMPPAFFRPPSCPACESLGGAASDFMASRPMPMMAAPINSDTAKVSPPPGGAGAGASSPATPRLQSQFVATPLFATVRTGADGTASLTFPAPVKLGTYVVRAYAAEGRTARYGGRESEMRVRRPLSLTPSLPRFARVGDAFSAGVVVTAPGLQASDGPLVANVSLVVTGPETGSGAAPLQLSGPGTGFVTLTASGLQQEVQFTFAAAALGTATLTFSASDAAGGTDAVQLTLDVHATQTALVVATSFPVRGAGPNATNASEWQEGLQLPDAVPGSGGLELSAGVGYLPSLIATYSALADDASERAQPSGYLAFALATLTPAASLYRLAVTEAQAAAVAQAVSDLSGPLRGNAQLGLLDAPPGPQWGGGYPASANIVLNSWAAWLTASWPFSPQAGSNASAGWESVQAAAATWSEAAARQLLSDAAAARSAQPPSVYSDFHSLAWVRLAVGASWQPPVCNGSSPSPNRGPSNLRAPSPRGAAATAALPVACAPLREVAEDLSLARLVREARRSDDLAVRLLTCLALQQQQATEGSVSANARVLLNSTRDLVLSSIRAIGRTAYLSAEPGGAAAADQGTQALALTFLLGWRTTATPATLVQKLAAHVAQGSGTSLQPRYPSLCPPRSSPLAAALSTCALAAYDAAAGSTMPSLELQAVVGNSTVLNSTFHPTSSVTLITTSTPWGALPAPASPNATPAALVFRANGTGEASIAAVLRFVPRVLLPFPTYRGIWVEAAIQAVDPLTGSPVGPSLATVPLASIVAITLQLTTPDDLGSVTVEALMPAGLEPLDPLLASGSSGLPGSSSSCGLDSSSVRQVFWWWWWPVCPAQDTLPSVVTFRYPRLTAGTWSVRFTAVAATPGDFVLPPVKAFVDQQPEVMGLTAAQRLRVCQQGAGEGAAPCVPVAVEPAPPPRPCPNDCSGNGACRLDLGQCVCAPSFTGEDCSQVVFS